MLKTRKTKIIAVLAAVGVIVGVTIAGTHKANAVTYSEMQFQQLNGCATVQSSYPAGSFKAAAGDHVVLGNCANAASQHFWVTSGNSPHEIPSQLVDGANGKSLCLTVYVYAGEPDGGPIVVGDCATAATQELYVDPAYYGHEAWTVNIKDSTGHYFAVNDKNDWYTSGNPLNASWYGSGNPSEDWYGPYPCLVYPNCT